MSRNTAALVGLGAKGRIEAGTDADLLMYDEAAELLVDVNELAHRNPISAYDGQRYDGRVVRTLVRGSDGVTGWGRQLRRNP